MFKRTLIICILAFSLVFPAQVSTSASAPQAAGPGAAAAQLGSQPQGLSAGDLSAFLDGLVPMQLQREDIAGAVVAVVKDGQLLFARGYGYADAAKKTPVLPESTLFRPGSISKLFTWTAVMQQVEQGKLDLDRDANTYLDFKIPASYPEPVTLRNLMTHTPGFEETDKNLIQEDARHLEPLGHYLGAHVPRRIFPPGGFRPTRITARRWPATSSSALPASLSTGMLKSTFSSCSA